jgi:phosphocarrier protein FPr
MVNLVIISHSRALAESLAELARQVAGQKVSIAAAGGAGEDHQEFGTDALDILTAIQSVDSSDGVLVLMDLGSAVLSAEMALELLPEDQRSHIRLCPAPLVEGSIAAAVQASLQSDLDMIQTAALNALAPKKEHLENTSASELPIAEQIIPPDTKTHTLVLKLTNPHGLHARPAAQFVQTAAKYEANIWVSTLRRPNRLAPANSLNALTSLGALQGDEIQITAQGPQAQAALQALKALVTLGFTSAEAETSSGEETVPTATGQIAPGVWKGATISEGFAVGPARFLRRQLKGEITLSASPPDSQWQALQNAIQQTQQLIRERYQQMRARVGEKQAAIFQAHLLMLQDPQILDNARRRIYENQENAVQAWSKAIEEAAQALLEVEDPYIQQRSADLRDVGQQTLQQLLGEQNAAITLEGEGILLADELSPNEIAQLDRQKVFGVITSRGAATSHSAILLRGLGIPAISGIDPLVIGVKEGSTIGIDGEQGMIWLNPAEEQCQKLRAERNTWLEKRNSLASLRDQPAETRDGYRVEMAANVGSLAEAHIAWENGAEAIGVLRTEFLFLKRQTAPDEEQQVEVLDQIATAMSGRPIIVRTLDIGGDKSVAYLSLPNESNPFLGVRGIRLSFRHPEIFLPQLKAVLRAAARHPLRLLLPMVSTLEEIQTAKQWLERAHHILSEEQHEHRYPIEVGIMVEVPSAALISENLAPQVDFFSIGTNDLTQYTLAAERGYGELKEYSDALHPAILKEIDQVVRAAHAQGKWAGVCGEIASDPLAAPIFIGLGVDELSMNPVEIPRIKMVVRRIRQEEAHRLAENALRCASASEVRRLASELLEKSQPQGLSQ